MNDDYIDMLKCLNRAGVDYIMVGGWAVNMYGRTKDLADVEALEALK